MEPDTEERKIELGKETIKHLNTARKWTMFLSIFGFILLGIIIIIGIIAGTFLTAFKSGGTNAKIPDYLVFVIFLVCALVYSFSVHSLFRFSKHLAEAVKTYDTLELHKAFRSLKSYFIFFGIFIIIILALYIVLLVLTGTSMELIKGL